MQFVWWLTGVLAVILGCKFVIQVFRRLGSKENLEEFIDRAQDGMNAAADRVGNYMKQKRKQKEEKNRPIVTIR